MQWGDYAIYDPGVSVPLDTAPRREARRAYNKLMQEKPERIAMLRRLLAANGVEIDETDAGIQRLNDWFAANVESSPDRPGFLAPVWYSVVSDITLFLGEVISARSPGVHWASCTGGKRNICYQQAMLVGFASHSRKQLGLERIVAGYGHRLVQARGSIPHYGTVTLRGLVIDVDQLTAIADMPPDEPDFFWHWIRVWTRDIPSTSA